MLQHFVVVLCFEVASRDNAFDLSFAEGKFGLFGLISRINVNLKDKSPIYHLEIYQSDAYTGDNLRPWDKAKFVVF